MSTRAMDMPVLKFVRRRLTHLDNLHLEEKIDAGQRMVSVYRNGILGHFRDGHRLALVGAEAHPRLHFLPAKSFLRYLLDKLRI